MSFFNINFFNAGGVFMRVYETPSPSSYSNIKLFGGGKFGTLYGERRIYSDTDITNINSKVEQDWLVDTYINAKFNSNLQAGNITSLPAPIDSWIIQRKAVGEAKFTTIAVVDDLVDTYDDRLVKSKQTYTYQLIPRANDVLGQSLQADPVTTDFTKVILLDPVGNTGYSFCLDMSVSDISIEEDITVNDTKGKYQTILKGNKEVNVGNLSFIITSNSNTYDELQQDVAFLDGFKDFILNGEEKVLKFTKGFTYRVYTSDFTKFEKEGNDRFGNKVYGISFSYREVGDV